MITPILLSEQFDYDQLVAAMRGCSLMLSDSGGLQEVALALIKSVLVLRQITERPEAMEASNAKLTRTSSADILREISFLLQDSKTYENDEYLKYFLLRKSE